MASRKNTDPELPWQDEPDEQPGAGTPARTELDGEPAAIGPNCTYCKEPVDVAGYKICSKCRTRMSQQRKVRLGKAGSERKCPQCGKVPETTKRHCNACLEKANEKARKGRREILRLCRDCGKGPVDPRYHRCEDCRRKSTNASTRAWTARKIIEGVCPQCCKQPLDGKTICAVCRDRAKRGRERQKRRCFALYGDACVCCGETDLSFLTLDHIHNDGAARRRSGEYPGCGTGTALYGWILKNGKRPEFQLMCMSCQISTKILTVCAHKSQGVMSGDGMGI